MKQKLINCCAGVLISVLFAGCNEFKQDQQQPPQLEEGTEISPIPVNEVSDEVVAFFDKYLPPISGSFSSECFFLEDRENRCKIINSKDELEAIMPSFIEFPLIDFDTYTLIVGQQLVRVGGLHTVKQGVINNSEKIELNLFLEPVDDYQDQAISILYYWGLYSKLPQKQINVNVIETDKNSRK